ncbi:MAG TPA: 2-oxo acid dehydrogenase subunit E2 [Bacteriovoracaceae bacterium]|nr:2-oxo acid dehydrogenase subunit E2 [Bacteriovoracaceae bacterium]
MNILSKNMDLGPAIKLSSWRKIAIGTWVSAKDPSVYGILDIDAAPALAYIEKVRLETGMKINLIHVLGKATALVLQRHPEINCVLRWGRLYPRRSVDVFFQVATDKAGHDLSGMTVRQADLKSVQAIATEMQDRVQNIREKGDPGFKKMKNTMGLIPGLFIGYVMNLAEFFLYSLNLWSPAIGAPKDSFGSVMITNVGSLGIETGFAPLVAYSRVPLLLALGMVRPVPVARDGKVVIEEQMRICATFDHRLIDGMVASHMTKALTKILMNPEIEFKVPPVKNKYLS